MKSEEIDRQASANCKLCFLSRFPFIPNRSRRFLDTDKGRTKDQANENNDDPNIMDNSGLMLMNLLSKLGTKEVYLAGFDGFGVDRRMNYYDGLWNISERSFLSAQNRSISTRIKQLSTKMKIDFITPSIYENSGDNEF